MRESSSHCCFFPYAAPKGSKPPQDTYLILSCTVQQSPLTAKKEYPILCLKVGQESPFTSFAGRWQYSLSALQTVRLWAASPAIALLCRGKLTSDYLSQMMLIHVHLQKIWKIRFPLPHGSVCCLYWKIIVVGIERVHGVFSFVSSWKGRRDESEVNTVIYCSILHVPAHTLFLMSFQGQTLMSSHSSVQIQGFHSLRW